MNLPTRTTGLKKDVATLLGISSCDVLLRSLVQRSLLDLGGFEANEFEQGEHSSATAGAVLYGYSTISDVSDLEINKLRRAALKLVDSTGAVRRDSRSTSPISSWAQSQLLLGLLKRDHLVEERDIQVLHRMAKVLVELQDPRNGGWSYYSGGNCDALFSFYPVLALSRYLVSASTIVDDSVLKSLVAARQFLLVERDKPDIGVGDDILVRRALNITAVVSNCPTPSEAIRSWDRDNFPVDTIVASYGRPKWHTIIWRPLYYLALSGGSSILDPLLCELSNELVAAFDPEVQAWHGPGAAGSKAGSPWASALAMCGVYKVAADLHRENITIQQWIERGAALKVSTYEFDVVISFSGSDRLIAKAISDPLKKAGYRVFYDKDFEHELLGEDLAQYLQKTYFSRSLYAIVVVSQQFMLSKWAGNWEWRAILARMQSQSEAYVLPYITEDVELPGMNPTMGFIRMAEASPAEFAQVVIKKLRAKAQ